MLPPEFVTGEDLGITLMTKWDTEGLIAADKKFIWHPFTNMPEWCASEHEPLVLVEGHGAVLRDSRGREYIDGNSSIWTNIHGHNHPHINAALWKQLEHLAHTSFLGFTNPPAIELARAIVDLFPKETLTRVFYSDDGSTGVEVALRVADQYWRLRNSRRHQFIAFQHAYHGDTAGAASLGAATMFYVGMSHWNFPAMQDWCDRAGALLIVDEVMTGFGRTGKMFAIEHEAIGPDIMVLGKGLSGGYLPLAITLVTDEIFSRFDGSVIDGKALAYGHSYTGNALGCAAAKANLEVFESENVLENLQPRIQQMSTELEMLRRLPSVAEVRQCGFIAGIEVAVPPGLSPSEVSKLGVDVCLAARDRGLLTRPLRNIIVLMPPLCMTTAQLTAAIDAIRDSIVDVCGQQK